MILVMVIILLAYAYIGMSEFGSLLLAPVFIYMVCMLFTIRDDQKQQMKETEKIKRMLKSLGGDENYGINTPLKTDETVEQNTSEIHENVDIKHDNNGIK